jgi:hypothetical protein
LRSIRVWEPTPIALVARPLFGTARVLVRGGIAEAAAPNRPGGGAASRLLHHGVHERGDLAVPVVLFIFAAGAVLFELPGSKAASRPGRGGGGPGQGS